MVTVAPGLYCDVIMRTMSLGEDDNSSVGQKVDHDTGKMAESSKKKTRGKKSSKTRQSMSTVQSFTLWQNISTESVYKSSFCSTRIPEIYEHSTNSIHGRLVYCYPKLKSVSFRSRDRAKSSCQTRFHYKLKEIFFGTNSKKYVCRGSFSCRFGYRNADLAVKK